MSKWLVELVENFFRVFVPILSDELRELIVKSLKEWEVVAQKTKTKADDFIVSVLLTIFDV